MERCNDHKQQEANECAWGMFLDTLLCRIGDVQDGETLALIAPAGSGGVRDQLVIHTDRDLGLRWVTRSWFGRTAAEQVVARADAEDGTFTLAEAVVREARDGIGLPHPQLFTAHAHGAGAAHLAECLGLADEGSVSEPGGDTTRSADHTAMVLAEVRDLFDGDVRLDDDGDVVFTLHGTKAFILFRGPGTHLEIAAPVATGVYSRRTAAVELDLLNRKGMWSTWFMQDRNVWLRSQVFARPLVREHVRWALMTFAEDLGTHRDELAYRLGARVA